MAKLRNFKPEKMLLHQAEFLGAKSVLPNLKTCITQSVFNVRKYQNFFLHHIGDMAEDFCGDAQTNVTTSNSQCFEGIAHGHHNWMHLIQTVYKAWKHFHNFFCKLHLCHRITCWESSENSVWNKKITCQNSLKRLVYYGTVLFIIFVQQTGVHTKWYPSYIMWYSTYI